MPLALNVAQMATVRFSQAAIQEMHYLKTEWWAEVTEYKRRHVLCTTDKIRKRVMENHPAMILHNHPDGCHPWHNSTATNPQTH
jgi:hypothetical protein